MFELPALISEIISTIPLARAMELRGLRYDGQELLLELPLQANINDKGCAFGGSMAAGAIVAGWGLVRLAIGESGRRADIFVQDQQASFLRPAWSTLLLRCAWETEAAKTTLLSQYDARGRARATLQVSISSDDVECFSMQARYALLRPK